MLTDLAQQSTNRTATRSELSSNWRTKLDATPTTGNNATARIPDLSFKPHFRQQYGSRGDSRVDKNRSDENVEGEILRGEDDPRTLQAIAEGRRLFSK